MIPFGKLPTAGELRRAGTHVPAYVPDHEVWPPVDVETIAQRVADILQHRASTDVLTKAEAMAYVKRGRSAFFEWIAKWQVETISRGRYSRKALDLALGRESGRIRTPSCLRRDQEAAA